MSERGVFAVDRGIWDHPIFADEPFTEREAWQWLIGEAAFRPHTRRIGKFVIDLNRGQLAASVRFMAEAWSWTPAKVQRFLKKLKTDTMVSTDAIRGISVITICNYGKYQRVSLPKDTPTDTQIDTAPIQLRYKEESTESTEVDDDDASAARGTKKSESLITPEAMILTERLLVIAGHDPKFWPPGWAGAPMRVQTWLSQGWLPEIIIAAVTGAAARKTGPPANNINYFENAVAEEVARQARPLPKVEIREAEIVQVRHETNRRSGNVVEAFRRLGEQVRSRNSDEASGNPVLGLPSR